MLYCVVCSSVSKTTKNSGPAYARNGETKSFCSAQWKFNSGNGQFNVRHQHNAWCRQPGMCPASMLRQLALQHSMSLRLMKS